MEKKFSLKNFIEREAEEEKFIKNPNSNDNLVKDTQYSSQTIQEEDNSYESHSDNYTERNTPKNSKELITHRLVLQNEVKKDELIVNKQLKRKRIPNVEKKDNKRFLAHVKNNMNKIEDSLGIINGKLNIGFAENKENTNINNKIIEDSTQSKKFNDEDDEEIVRLRLSNERKNMKNFNYKSFNKDFVKRIKENENFIKKNIIIINDKFGNKEKYLKRNKSDLNLNKKSQVVQHKLKIYSFKGAFLNKNKK